MTFKGLFGGNEASGVGPSFCVHSLPASNLACLCLKFSSAGGTSTQAPRFGLAKEPLLPLSLGRSFGWKRDIF